MEINDVIHGSNTDYLIIDYNDNYRLLSNKCYYELKCVVSQDIKAKWRILLNSNARPNRLNGKLDSRIKWPVELKEIDGKDWAIYKLPSDINKYIGLTEYMLNNNITNYFRFKICREVVDAAKTMNMIGRWKISSLEDIIFNPDTGDIIIQTAENVVIKREEEGLINNSPLFLSPNAIIKNKKEIDTEEILYSISVWLFCFLFGRHPLHTESRIKSITENKEIDNSDIHQIYGAGSRFCFSEALCSDTKSKSIDMWKAAPKQVRAAFVDIFEKNKYTDTSKRVINELDELCYLFTQVMNLYSDEAVSYILVQDSQNTDVYDLKNDKDKYKLEKNCGLKVELKQGKYFLKSSSINIIWQSGTGLIKQKLALNTPIALNKDIRLSCKNVNLKAI